MKMTLGRDAALLSRPDPRNASSARQKAPSRFLDGIVSLSRSIPVRKTVVRRRMSLSVDGHGAADKRFPCGCQATIEILLVPMLCVGTPLGRSASRETRRRHAGRSSRDAERPDVGTHAERGHQENML